MIIYFKQIATNSPVNVTESKRGTTKLAITDVNGPDGEQIFKAINDVPQSPNVSNTKKDPEKK